MAENKSPYEDFLNDLCYHDEDLCMCPLCNRYMLGVRKEDKE